MRHLSSVAALPPLAVLMPIGLALGVLMAVLLAGESWIPLILLTAVCVTPVCLRWPVVVTFGAYVIVLPFEQLLSVYRVATVNKLLGMLAVAALVAAGLVQRRLGRPPVAALWLAGYVVWALLSAAWAVDADAVLARLPTTISLFLLYLAAVSFRVSKQEFVIICVLTVAASAGAGVYSLFSGIEVAETGRRTLMTAENYASDPNYAIDPNYIDPNQFTASMLLPLALAIAGFTMLRSVTARVATLAAVVLMIAASVLTMSRGGLLAITVMVVILSVRLRPGPLLFVALVIAVATAFVMPERLMERFAMVLGGEDSTGSGRTEIWAIAVRLLRDYGVFGAGHSNFPIVYRGYDAAATVDTVAHNIYLGVWVELGIIGLVLLLGCFVVHLLHSRRVRQAVGVGVLASAIQAACVAALLAAAFIDVTWKKWFWLPWVLAAWAATLAESSRSVRATPTPASTGLPATTHGR